MTGDSISFDMSVRSALLGTLVLGLLVGVSAGALGVTALQDSGESDVSSTGDSPETSDTGDETGSEDSSGSETVSVSDLSFEDEPKLGSDDAEVTLVYWGDFNCAFCRRFAQNTFSDIREDYVQSGEVRVVYKNLITMGQDSVTLGKASQAAWNMVGEEDSDLYWRWHEQLSDDQPERKQNSQGVKEDIRSTTEKIDGINADELISKTENMSNEEIQGDIREAQQRGITGTPGFAVIETGSDEAATISGAQPYSKFQTEINKILNN